MGPEEFDLFGPEPENLDANQPPGEQAPVAATPMDTATAERVAYLVNCVTDTDLLRKVVTTVQLQHPERTRTTAEDVSQEAIGNALSKIMADPWSIQQPNALGSYVFTAALRILTDHARRARRQRELEDNLGRYISLHEATVAEEVTDLLGEALANLPFRQARVLVLRHMYDFSVREVAELLEMAEGTVKADTAYGIAAVKTYMAQHGYSRRSAKRPR